MWLDLGSNGDATGTWSGLRLKPGWDTWWWVGAGFPDPTGRSVGNIVPYQLAAGTETSNPVENLWEGIWRPAEYSNRTVGFFTWPVGANGFEQSSKMWVRDSGPPATYELWQGWTYIGQVSFPIVPAPGSGALLAAAVALLSMRRRR
jgi:hypothetical protein